MLLSCVCRETPVVLSCPVGSSWVSCHGDMDVVWLSILEFIQGSPNYVTGFLK